MNEKTKLLLVQLRCCLLLGGGIGLLSNCIGLFYTPISQELGVGRGSVALMVTLQSLASAFFSPVFAKLVKKIKIQHLMSAGVILSSLAVFVMSMAKSIYVFYVCGILAGIGVTNFSALPVSMILRSWFGEKSGSRLGIAQAFTGLCAAIFNPVLGRIITGSDYHKAFVFMMAGLFILCMPCAVTLRMKDEPAAAAKPTEKESAKAKAARDSVMTSALFATFLLCGFCITTQNGMNSHFSALAVSVGFPLTFGATVVSFQSIFNSTWKLIFGFVLDKLGPVRACNIFNCIGFTGVMILLLGSRNPILLIIGVSMYACNFSVSTVGIPTLMMEAAGKNYIDYYSKQNMVQTVAYAFGTTMYGTLSDITGGYTVPLIVVEVMTVSAFLLLRRIGRKIYG
jgi:MFS family permease